MTVNRTSFQFGVGVKTALRFGVGVSTFGVLAHALTAFVLFTFPQHVLSGEAGGAFVATWFDPISTVGRTLAFFATPLLAGISTFYLVWSGVAVRHVLAGFAIGAVAFGIGIAFVSFVATGPARRGPMLEYVGQTTRQTVRVLGPAVVGALAGEFMGKCPKVAGMGG